MGLNLRGTCLRDDMDVRMYEYEYGGNKHRFMGRTAW